MPVSSHSAGHSVAHTALRSAAHNGVHKSSTAQPTSQPTVVPIPGVGAAIFVCLAVGVCIVLLMLVLEGLDKESK